MFKSIRQCSHVKKCVKFSTLKILTCSLTRIDERKQTDWVMKEYNNFEVNQNDST